MPRRAATLNAQQLGLFEEAVPVALPPAGALRDGVAATPSPDDPVPPASAPPPALFRHPQTSREIRLGEHLVGYALKRVRRRSIGFIVGPEGLSVNAPKWIGLREIEAALQEKTRWILNKLREQRERARRLQSAKVDWRDGTSIPFLGETVIVVLDPRATGAVLNTAADALPGVPRLTLHIGLPHTAAPEQIRDAVQSWLQRQARRVFEERCRHFATQLGVDAMAVGDRATLHRQCVHECVMLWDHFGEQLPAVFPDCAKIIDLVVVSADANEEFG